MLFLSLHPASFISTVQDMANSPTWVVWHMPRSHGTSVTLAYRAGDAFLQPAGTDDTVSF